MEKTEISIVAPMYNEEDNINKFHEKVSNVLRQFGRTYEIILVDDGSRDNTFKLLEALHKRDKNVKVIRLRKNFGKAAALSAGFEHASGELVVTMDGDLQDEPEEIPKLIKKLEEGYDLVSGWKTDKHKGSMKRISSLIFNKFSARLTGVNIHDFNCPFKAYRNEVIKDITIYGEMHRFIPVFAQWKGYKIGEIKVLNYPRKAGKSKYGSIRLLEGFLDLITVKFLSSFRSKPLHLFGTIGLFLFLLGAISGVYLVIQWFMGVPIGNRPLLLLSALMTMVGIQFAGIGLLGEMVTNNAEKQQKSYTIKEVLGR